MLWIDTGQLELVDHPLRVIGLAAEDLVDTRRITLFEFGRMLHAVALVELDAFLEVNNVPRPV